jgi:hypothetical protein
MPKRGYHQTPEHIAKRGGANDEIRRIDLTVEANRDRVLAVKTMEHLALPFR